MKGHSTPPSNRVETHRWRTTELDTRKRVDAVRFVCPRNYDLEREYITHHKLIQEAFET